MDLYCTEGNGDVALQHPVGHYEWWLIINDGKTVLALSDTKGTPPPGRLSPIRP